MDKGESAFTLRDNSRLILNALMRENKPITSSSLRKQLNLPSSTVFYGCKGLLAKGLIKALVETKENSSKTKYYIDSDIGCDRNSDAVIFKSNKYHVEILDCPERGKCKNCGNATSENCMMYKRFQKAMSNMFPPQ